MPPAPRATPRHPIGQAEAQVPGDARTMTSGGGEERPLMGAGRGRRVLMGQSGCSGHSQQMQQCLWESQALAEVPGQTQGQGDQGADRIGCRAERHDRHVTDVEVLLCPPRAGPRRRPSGSRNQRRGSTCMACASVPAAWWTVPQPKPLPPWPYQTSFSGRAAVPLIWNCEKIWWVTLIHHGEDLPDGSSAIRPAPETAIRRDGPSSSGSGTRSPEHSRTAERA